MNNFYCNKCRVPYIFINKIKNFNGASVFVYKCPNCGVTIYLDTKI